MSLTPPHLKTLEEIERGGVPGLPRHAHFGRWHRKAEGRGLKRAGCAGTQRGAEPPQKGLWPPCFDGATRSPARLPPAPGEPYYSSGYKGQNRKLDDLSVLLYEGVIGAQGPP